MADYVDHVGPQTATTWTDNAFLIDNTNFRSKTVIISSAARDATATRTTKLRPGLVLGQITASKKYKEYDNSASDGSQVAKGILAHTTDLLDADAAAQDAEAVMVDNGRVDNAKLYGIDAAGRTDLSFIQFENV